jgi:hypothetical protein
VRTTTASPTGSYRRRIPDKPGRFRATARNFPSGPVITPCFRVISPVRIEADRPLGRTREPAPQASSWSTAVVPAYRFM